MKELVIKNITIGDELLIGQVINTNAAWLGEHLSEAGFHLDSVLTIGDSERAILDAFDACMDAELVLVTGGLGPTADDITKPTVCKFFDTELEYLRDWWTRHIAYLDTHVFIPYPLGDVNFDRVIDINDVTALIDCLLGLQERSINQDKADYNRNGIIDINDITNIIDIIFNL